METSSRSSNKETKDDYRGDIVYIYIYIYIYNQASEKYRYEERKVTGECAS
jgi:hypothetical protein